MAHKHLHEHMLKHMPGDTRIARFNRKFAASITAFVGSMKCAYLFTLLALVSLPAILTEAFHLNFFPHWLISVGLIALVAWVAQTFLQLVLLSVIMVGQDVQAQATTESVAKTESNTDMTVDILDLETEGGLKVINDKLDKLLAK